MKKPTMLMILDGYGLNPSPYGNAIAAAKTPNLDRLFAEYPTTQLAASGLAVGLPEGQMGNSEVGHLNIGAGRIVYQELTRITKAIDDGMFFNNVALNQAIDHVLNGQTDGRAPVLHLFGLLSDGGVHSHVTHLHALVRLAKKRGVKRLYLHCFMDGRDVPPTSGLQYLRDLQDFLASEGLGGIGIIVGRYYAMDRDKRWERLQLAYDALTLGAGRQAADPDAAMQAAYDAGETDEFIQPIVCHPDAEAQSTLPLVRDNDAVIMYNFRPDRAREITRAFVDPNFDSFPRKKIPQNLCYVCMTQYDATMPNVAVAFPPQRLTNTLGEYLSGLGLHQLRIAETEKYAHVTFFFNGGVEAPNPLEDRILIPSPAVATYDLQPEMSAFLITEQVIREIQQKSDGKPSSGENIKQADESYALIVLNFANADMVGHTGVFDATVKAIEALDQCVGKIVAAMLAAGGQILLTADHGNADYMLNENGHVVTSHSTNPVPLIHIAHDPIQAFAEGGKLADIAPTLLRLMELPVPPEMTGRCLLP